MPARRTLALVDARDPRVERTWRDLEARARPPYFLSWGWVESWLAALPAERRPRLAVISDDGEPVAACFLGERRLRRHLVLPSRALYFNATGVPEYDDIYIEHNGLLAVPGASRSLADLVELLPGDWDEVFLPALDEHAFDQLEPDPGRPAYRVRVEREEHAPYVDLDAVRAAEGGYLALLGSGTRSQLRRAQRKLGALELEIASDDRHALDIYNELLHLHARRWQARGEAGAFANPWFDGFHRRLIAQRLPHGEIQLVRVRAGGATVGCLYNFVFDGRVLFYQSGLAAFDDPHVKPGFLCHAAAVEHNAAAGHAIYDLLGGASRYKQQLSTGAHRLVWLRVQRPRVRFALEDRVRRWKHALAAARAATPPSSS